MADEKIFERGIAPEQEMRELREKIAETPERAREILGEHLEKEPREVYGQEHALSEEAISEMGQAAGSLSGREDALRYLLDVAREKGILNAAKIAREADPSLLDEFHDSLVKLFHS